MTPPNVQQLRRVHALAARAGLSLRTVDPEAFISTYKPCRYGRFVLPPPFVWLCTLCEPAQLSRIWIVATTRGELNPLQPMNDELRRGPIPWPEYLVAFAATGDETFCFAYGAPDESEPAVVSVDGYTRAEDEHGQPYIDWDWQADHFRAMAFDSSGLAPQVGREHAGLARRVCRPPEQMTGGYGP